MLPSSQTDVPRRVKANCADPARAPTPQLGSHFSAGQRAEPVKNAARLLTSAWHHLASQIVKVALVARTVATWMIRSLAIAAKTLRASARVASCVCEKRASANSSRLATIYCQSASRIAAKTNIVELIASAIKLPMRSPTSFWATDGRETMRLFMKNVSFLSHPAR